LLDPWRLIGARRATELTGSAILGLAVEAGAFPAADVFSAARLDERFQGEKWGEDEEALARERRIEGEFLMIARWLELLGS
jgi:chaperone required for assembly of F1-ATPase